MERIGAVVSKSLSKVNRYHLLLVAILILAAFFRFSGLSDREIWYDEALTVVQSEKSISQINHDVPTPVHYYFVRLFLLFGKSTFILGFPSVIFGLLSVWLIYLIGKKIGGENVGLLAAFLLAISPMQIEFSQQILHYSYFVFFTLASLFFYLNFIVSFKDGATKYSNIRWLILVSIINVLTHISALLVIAIEVIFFVLVVLALGRWNMTFLRKNWLFLVIAVVLSIFAVLAFGSGYHINLFKNLVNYGSDNPIELGFSLSKQLGSQVLIFNKDFFTAMFSWFGFGNGFRLYALLLSFFLGIVAMIRKKMFTSLFLLLFWIAYPFVQLYFVRPVHWFEEKYFIFMIPAYLLIISGGILLLAEMASYVIKNIPILKKTNKINALYFFQVIIVAGFLWMSLLPIKSRTTYGFIREDQVVYSWKEVYTYLKNNIKEGDRVFVRNGEGAFFNFYFSKEKKNKIWFEEGHLFGMNSEEFSAFAGGSGDNYFISIPDIENLFLADSFEKKDNKKIGGFNVYRMEWKRDDSIELKKDSSGKLQYYDDFRTSKFFSNALNWNNFTISNYGNFNLPLTYGYNNLTPIGESHSDVVYHFSLSDGDIANNLFLRPSFSLNQGDIFSVSIGHDPNSMAEIFQKKSDILAHFSPDIKLNLDGAKNDFFIKISYDLSDNNSENIAGRSSIKSILLYDVANFNAERYEIYYSKALAEDKYDAELEYKKNNKWKRDAIKRDGWVQADDGVLYNSGRIVNGSDLIYKVGFSRALKNKQIKIKSYVLNNKMGISYSNDGVSWGMLDEIENSNMITRTYQLNDIMSDKIFFRFHCEIANSSCQLRNLEVTASGAKEDFEDNSLEYDYDARLGIDRENKWIYDTVQNDGWIQANDGILFMRNEDYYAGQKPLIYDFKFEKKIESINLEVETFTFNNGMSIYYSMDQGDSWSLIGEYDNDNIKSNGMLIEGGMTKNLQLKFNCDKSGPTCQLRNLKFKAFEAKSQ